MRAPGFKFSLASAVGASGGAYPILQEDGGAVADRYTVPALGNVSVHWRAFLIRVTLFKMLACAVLSALLAVQPRNSPDAALGLAYCAAVCAIATGHYYMIMLVRQQTPPQAFESVALLVGEELKEGEGVAQLQKLASREFAVDMLRHSDW